MKRNKKRDLFKDSVLELVESIPDETELGISESLRTLDTWLCLIENSQRTIDIETFYMVDKEGKALNLVFNALKKAVLRGVAVRIIADAKLAQTYPDTLNLLGGLEGVDVRRLNYFNRMEGVLHAKYFVVDREELFVGSQNFDWRALNNIHELGLYVKNRKLAEWILKIFELDWEIAGNEDNPEKQKKILETEALKKVEASQIDPTAILKINEKAIEVFPAFSPKGALLPGMENEEEALLNLIGNAKTKIEIQLLSYSPVTEKGYYGAIDNALRSAAVRGVQIRMIVSNWNIRKPDIYYLKSLQIMQGIEIGISAVPEHSSGFIPFARVEHCKYMVVDEDAVWIGTGNWSKDYFYSSRNVALVIKDDRINKLTDKIFNKSWNSGFVDNLDPCKEYVPPVIDTEF